MLEQNTCYIDIFRTGITLINWAYIGLSRLFLNVRMYFLSQDMYLHEVTKYT